MISQARKLYLNTRQIHNQPKHKRAQRCSSFSCFLFLTTILQHKTKGLSMVPVNTCRPHPEMCFRTNLFINMHSFFTLHLVVRAWALNAAKPFFTLRFYMFHPMISICICIQLCRRIRLPTCFLLIPFLVKNHRIFLCRRRIIDIPFSKLWQGPTFLLSKMHTERSTKLQLSFQYFPFRYENKIKDATPNKLTKQILILINLKLGLPR